MTTKGVRLARPAVRLPTTHELLLADAAGLVIDAPPSGEGKGKQSPIVWYWSVKDKKCSWLGSWCPGTLWWWTYRAVGGEFRGKSGDFGAVLAVFEAAAESFLSRRKR